ncbi:MAG: TolB protein [Rhodocyclaceae bacterium]|nr:TolB protein [Rhodocyclaceae bacterium]
MKPAQTVLALGLTMLAHSVAVHALPATAADAEVAFVSIRNGNAHIFLSDGKGNDRALTVGESVNLQPSWSPDGTQIAFTSNREGLSKVFVMDAQGGEARRLTADDAIETTPSWSPDGSAIAFYSRGAASDQVELRVVELASGKHISIVGNGLEKGPDVPAWSADGRRIAFPGIGASGKSEIWVAERDGSNLREVSANASKRTKGQPSLSPDGSQVAYVADMRGAIAIFVTDLATGESRNLTAGVEASHENPRWSPDGKQLLFSSSRDDEGRTRMDIFVMNADGSEVRNLTRHPHEDFNAQWSGDGRRVVFNSLRTGTSQIFALDLMSGATLRMSENTSHDLEFATRPVAR